VKIKTNHPIINDRTQITKNIADFWNKISAGWQTIWGPHIHHGYYDHDSLITPLEAQEKLIEKLTDLISVKYNDHVLDVGCGLGGSSLYLAKKYSAKVTGVTLSKTQVTMATQKALDEKINQVTFMINDALTLNKVADHSIDLVWSLESCEQFYDKALFLKQVFRVLKPGGQFMLATWCSDREEYEDTAALQYKKLCYEFDLPYMPTIACYHSLLTAQHFIVKNQLDWSHYVAKSWDVGIGLLKHYSLFQLIKMTGLRGYRFAKQVKLMQQAFREDRVKYGVFILTKPS
jgi:tocopherol O-methyltransferase